MIFFVFETPLSTIFLYIVVVSFIGGGNRMTQRNKSNKKPLDGRGISDYFSQPRYCGPFVFNCKYNPWIFQSTPLDDVTCL
jgi:hypothetical protein